MPLLSRRHVQSHRLNILYTPSPFPTPPCPHHPFPVPTLIPKMPFRALIKTHHMTSRRKIRTLSSAAKTHACTVVLKTGRPPGVMIAESDSLDELQEWVDVVKVCCLLSFTFSIPPFLISWLYAPYVFPLPFHLPFGSLPFPSRPSGALLPKPSTTAPLQIAICLESS